MRSRVLAVMPVAAALFTAGPRALAAGPGRSAECASLRSTTLPNVTIAVAEPVMDSAFTPPGARAPLTGLPPFCRVAGEITPTPDSHIRFEVWLPLGERWSGRFVGVGNGGWAGVISYAALADQIRRGNAVASTNTGHDAIATGVDQAMFAFGHPDRFVDFAWRAVHETTVTGKALARALYGKDPAHAYWVGCSTGGRQGLMEAQRFPEDYDGVLAGAPANNWSRLMTGPMAMSLAAVDSATALDAGHLQLVQRAVLAACDGIDGVTDGVLEDPRRCTFDPASLQCTSQSEPNACLTTAQIETVRRTYAGMKDPRTGAVVFPGLAMGSEPGWVALMSTTPFPVGISYYRWVIFGDSTWDWRTFDLARPAIYAGYEKSEKTIAPLVSAISPDLGRFRRRGGKLIQYHGWGDQLISPFNSIDYYNSVVSAMRAGRDDTAVRRDVDAFYRLYMVPGMAHCGGGPGTSSFDLQSVLEAWVEAKTVPGAVKATHATNRVVDRSRPLCPFPGTAAYKGSGDTNDWSSFSCVEPGGR